MKKSKEPKERKELSAKEFTKLFIKNFFLNSILVGIVLGLIYELLKGALPNLLKTVLSLVLTFIGIMKIYLSAINDTFYEGKIYKSDVNKIAKNILITFFVVFLINVIFDSVSYISSLRLAKALGLEDITFRNFIINIIIDVVLYLIIAISCRVKFLKESSKEENIIESENI